MPKKENGHRMGQNGKIKKNDLKQSHGKNKPKIKTK